MSDLRRLFEEFVKTENRPHAHRPRVTTPAQGRYIRIPHLCCRLGPATSTTDETVGLFNRQNVLFSDENMSSVTEHMGSSVRGAA